MTKDEIKKLGWQGSEKYALYNTRSKSFFLTSDTKQACLDALQQMTPRHPVYHDLQLIEKPE